MQTEWSALLVFVNQIALVRVAGVGVEWEGCSLVGLPRCVLPGETLLWRNRHS